MTTSKSETEDGVKIYTKVEVQGLRFIKDKEKAEKVEERVEKKRKKIWKMYHFKRIK